MDSNVIKKISLNNFRSHEKYSLRLKDNPTLILGKNGSGKTSVLEAIYIAMQGKSFRATDKEIVKHDSNFYRIELEFSSGEKTIVLYQEDNGKKFLSKDKKTTRLPKEAKYPVVLFLPEDLHIVATSPLKRRDYFDNIISQINDNHSRALARYNKALKQRNELLKQESVTLEDTFSWDIMLAKYGVEIRKNRSDIINLINKDITNTYDEIAKNQDVTKIRYDSYTENVDESNYLRLLHMDFERDSLVGHTNFGIHKDDFIFLFNGKNADGSASRGEVRSIVLSLKFIEAKIIEEKLQKRPVVLLDDVFSELDKTRQKSLTSNFSNHQVILTSVDEV
ncbi:DNA replication and repair protein RecF [Candidatus Saccharibacteria bacterium]|nr:DNA replication and repair protein RecF [Candidatus Saccharibacteria bacterium]